MQTKQIYGLLVFLIGSLLYTLNQSIKLLLFANVASEIIYTMICYLLISIGIAAVAFEEIGSQFIIGLLSIVITIVVFNAILLVWDSFTAIQYTSTQYFILFEYAIDLGLISDKKALIFISIAPSVGLLLWMLLSKNDSNQYYRIGIFAFILFIESWIFAAITGISIF